MRDYRGHTAVAAIGGLIALAGIGLATLQPAFADDDDWHTEADRPLAAQPSKADTDRDDPMPHVAAKPVAETLYAPPGLIRSMPSFPYVFTAYQTADVARPR
jgi:hypothetical protein